MKIIVDVEICQNADSTLPENVIKELIEEELNNEFNKTGKIPTDFEITNSLSIHDHIKSVSSTVRTNKTVVKNEDEIIYQFFIYRLTEEDAAVETMKNGSEELPVSSHWILPSGEFYGLWDSLCYDSDIKESLLKYIETTMVFSDKNVNHHIISWNKVVLLHGPPGTGKTSLCKALAQKATIRLNKRFTRGELVEINSHSLFSKWFSESGKLVMKLFSEIKLLLDDPQALVFILIDEVESLAHARRACTNGAEPSDSIRVVNSLLTQLDHMKRFKNVIILTTSNITEAIDLAFVDRADIKQYIGYPGKRAVESIYSSCIEELKRTDLIDKDEYCNWNDDLAEKLKSLSIGLSGRTLRKLPFLAHALYLNNSDQFSLSDFFTAMIKAAENCSLEEKNLTGSTFFTI